MNVGEWDSGGAWMRNAVGPLRLDPPKSGLAVSM